MRFGCLCSSREESSGFTARIHQEFTRLPRPTTITPQWHRHSNIASQTTHMTMCTRLVSIPLSQHHLLLLLHLPCPHTAHPTSPTPNNTSLAMSNTNSLNRWYKPFLYIALVFVDIFWTVQQLLNKCSSSFITNEVAVLDVCMCFPGLYVPLMLHCSHLLQRHRGAD